MGPAAPPPDAARIATVASWYDDAGPIACGRGTIPRGARGVAHRTLPCGTRVGICLPDLSRCVEARVVDRGPYVAGRDLDLLPATYAALAPLSSGVVRVAYRAQPVGRCVPAWARTYWKIAQRRPYAPTCPEVVR